jgi:hypothetical protein
MVRQWTGWPGYQFRRHVLRHERCLLSSIRGIGPFLTGEPLELPFAYGSCRTCGQRFKHSEPDGRLREANTATELSIEDAISQIVRRLTIVSNVQMPSVGYLLTSKKPRATHCFVLWRGAWPCWAAFARP